MNPIRNVQIQPCPDGPCVLQTPPRNFKRLRPQEHKSGKESHIFVLIGRVHIGGKHDQRGFAVVFVYIMISQLERNKCTVKMSFC